MNLIFIRYSTYQIFELCNIFDEFISYLYIMTLP
jgi:hypothetical protein